jgi:hypothetical protein
MITTCLPGQGRRVGPDPNHRYPSSYPNLTVDLGTGKQKQWAKMRLGPLPFFTRCAAGSALPALTPADTPMAKPQSLRLLPGGGSSQDHTRLLLRFTKLLRSNPRILKNESRSVESHRTEVNTAVILFFL